MVDTEVRERVFAWRARDVHVRFAQASLVAPLAFAEVRSPVVFVWYALSILAIAAERFLVAGRRAAYAPAAFTAASLAGLALSTGVFATVSILLLGAHEIGLVSAVLVLTATAISSAVMARGWPLATTVSSGYATLLLLACGPVAAFVFGQPLSPLDLVLYEVAAGACAAFTLLLGGTLHRDGVRLARARARWRTLFDSSPVPLVAFDAAPLFRLGADHGPGLNFGAALGGRIPDMGALGAHIVVKDANAAFRRLLGADDPSFSRFDARFLSNLLAELDRVGPLAPLPPIEGGLDVGDGRTLDVAVHIRALESGGRPWSDCLASIVDLSADKAAARAKAAAAEAAEAANRAKTEFLAVASHEIRTPLNGVLGMAQVMDRDPLAPRQRRRLEMIRRSGVELLRILNSILDIAKIEAGAVEIAREPFALGPVLEDMESAYAALAESRGLRFACDPGGLDGSACVGDAGRVRQVLHNLLSNALKFTERGTVSLRLARDGDWIAFEVSDTGPGVAPADAERLFERFTQGDASASRRHEGVGLGLAISRDLCRRMGGDLTLAGAPGGGSRFTARLPLPPAGPPASSRRPSEETTAEAKPTPAVGPRSDGGRVKVLCAEDHEVNRAVIEAVLATLDVDLTFVTDGGSAVAAWRAGAFDLVLMDIRMPVMDGVEATRSIRDIEAEQGAAPVPIIALSANVMPDQVETYRRSGFSGFVGKPIDFDELISAVAAASRTPAARADA